MSELKPGQRVRVTQEVDRREGNWKTVVEGEVVELRSEKTGSWFAHGKDQKLWVNRIVLRKQDGEISVLAVDQATRVEVLQDAEA